ncbi:MAG: hypothetical protein WCE46_03930, partial [Methanoregula sp.]|uniref:hypothetical protein n=1 Tax=Methanoregula sp. TaxID=2052170 RepID=UPI003C7595EB
MQLAEMGISLETKDLDFLRPVFLIGLDGPYHDEWVEGEYGGDPDKYFENIAKELSLDFSKTINRRLKVFSKGGKRRREKWEDKSTELPCEPTGLRCAKEIIRYLWEYGEKKPGLPPIFGWVALKDLKRDLVRYRKVGGRSKKNDNCNFDDLGRYHDETFRRAIKNLLSEEVG